MANACLNAGHNGAASESSQIQMDSLFDITEHLGSFFKTTEAGFTTERLLKDELIPGGIGRFGLTRAGEIIYYYKGKPVAFITRLACEKGCDANVGKWYRKQWYFENFLKKQNPECNHITFIHASADTGMLQEVISGVSMVMSQDFNAGGFNCPNFGGNSIYYYDTDKPDNSWREISAIILSITSLTLCRMKAENLKLDLFTV